MENNEISHLRGLQVSVFCNFVPFSKDFKVIFTCPKSLSHLSEFSKPPGALYRQQRAVQHPGDFQPEGKTTNIFDCT